MIWVLAWCCDWKLTYIQGLLEYVLHLQSSGLMLTSLRVHLVVILCFSPIHGKSAFSNPMKLRFLKGVTHFHPPVKELILLWDLNTVLEALMGPLATFFFSFLYQKTAFLVVMSARRKSDLQSLKAKPPCMQFSKNKITLQLHPKILSKVVSQFCLNQAVYLPMFFPKSYSTPKAQTHHTVDVRRCLALYLDRTKPFHSSSHFFVSYAVSMKGEVVSS